MEKDNIAEAILRLSNANSEVNDLTSKRVKSAIEVLNNRNKIIADMKTKQDKSTGIMDKLKHLFCPSSIEKFEIPKISADDERKINKAFNCSKCACISCDFPCKNKFNSCYYCVGSDYVSKCDKNNCCVISREKSEKLFIREFNRDCDFNTKAVIKYINKNGDVNEYLYLIDKDDEANEQLQGYKIDIKGNEEFISLSEEELDLIYDKYIEVMGEM